MNQCTYCEGQATTFWKLHYLPLSVRRVPTRPRGAELKGGLLSPPCNTAPLWGPGAATWFNSTTPHGACTPNPGYLFLCSSPQNELPNDKLPNGVYRHAPIALAYLCIDNS